MAVQKGGLATNTGPMLILKHIIMLWRPRAYEPQAVHTGAIEGDLLIG